MHKLEKLILESYGQLLTEMDGGRLFDYFKAKGYDITERSADGGNAGFQGYMVSRGESRSPQAVIFQYNKDSDEFTISRMSGYRIDQDEAIKAGMRQAGRSSVAGMDSYMTDGNYTPVSISAEGLKDIVDHVMTGLDREGEAQRAYYADRGRTSGTIDEMSLRQIEKESGGSPTQWEDLTDAQRAGIVKRYGEPNFDGKHDFFGKNMETYFKATEKNDETGSIMHKVIKLPSFASIYHNFSDIIADIKKLMGSDDVRKDERARELFDIVKTNFRKLQRYLRTERPEQYRMLKMQRMMEGIEKTLLKLEVKYTGPFVYSNRMSDEELKDMYDAALDGYANYQKGMQHSKADYKKAYQDIEAILKSRGVLNESLLDEVEDEPQPEEKGDKDAPKDTVLEDATDQILAKFPTLKAAIIKLQTEDFKEFVDKIDWISPRPTEFRINLKNGQDYILKWTGTGFEAQIMGKRFYIDKINDYQQALDKLAILYKEGPMTGAGEGEPADVDSGGSSGGGGGDFPGDDAGGGGGLGDDDAGGLGADDAGDAGGGADLTGEPVDFEEPAEEPEA